MRRVASDSIDLYMRRFLAVVGCYIFIKLFFLFYKKFSKGIIMVTAYISKIFRQSFFEITAKSKLIFNLELKNSFSKNISHGKFSRLIERRQARAFGFGDLYLVSAQQSANSCRLRLIIWPKNFSHLSVTNELITYVIYTYLHCVNYHYLHSFPSSYLS